MQQTTDFLTICCLAARQQLVKRAFSAILVLSVCVSLSLWGDFADGAEPPPVQIERLSGFWVLRP